MPKPSSISIEDAVVVTMDPRRRVLQGGSVLVEDGKIVEVRGGSSKRSERRPELKISAKGMALVPGLIDTHLHLAQSLLRGCADDLSLVQWLKERVWPIQGSFTEDDGRLSAELSMLEMIKSGTTSFVGVDVVSRYGFDGIARAVTRAGMRGALAKTIMDSPGYGRKGSIMPAGLVENKEDCIKEAKSMIKKWNGQEGGLVKTWVAPRSLGGCSEELYEEVAHLAKDSDARVTMHLAEVREDVKYAKQNFGLTPFESIRKVGLAGPRSLFAHMVWLSDSDVTKVARSGSNVAHCPSSNLKLASGIPKIPELLGAGANVGLGCDGAPCNNSYDMIREMKLAAVIQKGRLLDPLTMPAWTVLEMATMGGARAMGMASEVGSIEVGKKADLVLVDLKKPHLTPYRDIVSNIVYSAMGSDVDSVMVDGRLLLREGRALTLDEERIVGQAQKSQEELISRSGVGA
ncbi:MAG TPA: amidohydrolase [Nitrososphaerales archaeon]|nr:amidohydrolase [Nitrososphaerales archaeon]